MGGERVDEGREKQVRNPYRFQEGDSFWTGHEERKIVFYQVSWVAFQ